MMSDIGCLDMVHICTHIPVIGADLDPTMVCFLGARSQDPYYNGVWYCTVLACLLLVASAFSGLFVGVSPKIQILLCRAWPVTG